MTARESDPQSGLQSARMTTAHGQRVCELALWSNLIARLTFRPLGLDFFIVSLQFVQLHVSQSLDIYKLISRAIHCKNQFVQFQVHSAGVAILHVLNEKDHEKGCRSCSGTDGLCP